LDPLLIVLEFLCVPRYPLVSEWREEILELLSFFVCLGVVLRAFGEPFGPLAGTRELGKSEFEVGRRE
jgi:hypothetical protein